MSEVLQVKLLDDAATIPTRANPHDAGLDLYAAHTSFIPVNGTKVIHTGIAVSIPPGFVGKIESRSGLASKGIFVSGGIIDADYTGEIKIVVNNFSNKETYHVEECSYGKWMVEGKAIAQLVLYPINTPKVQVVAELPKAISRGDKGFASSDKA